jgi:hypothetical protein
MARPGVASAALAFVVVVILVAATAAVMAIQTPATPGTTSSQRTSESSSATTTGGNGLRLSLGATPSTVRSGTPITVTLSDFNTLNVTSTPSMMPLPTIGGVNLGLWSCSQLPLGFGIASGYYDVANVSRASLLDLNEPGEPVNCPALFVVDYFTFAPFSDRASLYSLQPTGPGNLTVPTLMWTAPDSFDQSFSGYWTGQRFIQGNVAFHSFETGVYTLIGADAYGQLAVVHFNVQAGASTTGGTSASAPSIDGLELMVSLNATKVLPGQEVQVNLSEFNTLPAVDNVSASGAWPVSVALGSCENVFDQPFGIAVYYGHVDGQNLSQGQRVAIFPIVACPMYVRLVTGYVFQPQSDLAVILPGSGATPSPLVGSVNVGMNYSSRQGQPLSTGTYTVVVADEWGALAFVYFQVVEG